MIEIGAYVHDIKEELRAAGFGNRQGVLLKYAAIMGCSADTIYRAMRKQLGRQKTLVRPKQHERSLIDQIAEIKMQGMLLSKGGGVERELSTARCIEILKVRGVAGADKLTVSTVNRRLEEIGFRLRKPRARVEAPYANFEWQMDFSRSKYFQLDKFDKATGDYVLKVSGRELHYKMDDKRLRTWIVQIKDSYSRLRDARAYAAAGESALIGLDMIHRVLNRDDDDPHPLRYAPERLKTDNGSFGKRKETSAAMAAIGVEIKLSSPGNSASQGKVESGFRSLWWTYELELAVKLGDGGTIRLTDYNDLLTEAMLKESALPHPYLAGVTRGGAYWQSVQKHPQTYIEADILQHAFRVEERGVDGSCLFSYLGKQYRAPQHCAGRRIRVYANLSGDVVGELLDSYDKPFACTAPAEGRNYPAWDMDDFDHRPHPTYQETLTAKLRRAKHDREPYVEGNRVYMPPKEQTRKAASPFSQSVEEFGNMTQARVWIGRQLVGLGYQYADFAEIFEELLGETLDKTRVRQKVDDLRRVLLTKVENL